MHTHNLLKIINDKRESLCCCRLITKLYLVYWDIPVLCNTIDCSLSGSSVHRIFQVRILEWAVISFSRRSSHARDLTRISHWQVNSLLLSHQGSLYIYIYAYIWYDTHFRLNCLIMVLNGSLVLCPLI